MEAGEILHFTVTHKAGPSLEIEPLPQSSHTLPAAYDKQLGPAGLGEESFYFQLPIDYFSRRVVLGARERTNEKRANRKLDSSC